MKIDVFNYMWTDANSSKEEASVSPCKVTRKCYEDRKRHDIGKNYQIIEESRDLVEDNCVLDGEYLPELRNCK